MLPAIWKSSSSMGSAFGGHTLRAPHVQKVLILLNFFKFFEFSRVKDVMVIIALYG
jgi:hypothetical protein